MSDRLFRLLLLLYPGSFRTEYGSELRADFAIRRRTSPSWLLWPETIGDTVWNAAAAHFDVLHQDLRWSLRSLCNTAGFSVTVIAVTALGIGATTAVFTLADHVLIRPLPFREPDRLVKVWESTPNYGRLEASPANYRDWLAMDPPFEDLAAWRQMQVNISGQGEPRMVDGSAMTANMLPMLGVRPMIGRSFTADDDRRGTPLTVLLSFAEWRDYFASDPGVVGRKLIMDGKAAEVIGVMPQWFRYPTQRVRLWTAMRFNPEDFEDRTNTYLLVDGRMKPGVSLAQARGRMTAIASRLEKQYPIDNAKMGVRLFLLKDEIPQQSRMLLYALTGAGGGVLLIACINLANLLLARAVARRRELAIRRSLGAGAQRLTRQLMTENLVLSMAGGLAGAMLGLALLPLLAKLVPTTLPIQATPKADARVWAICAGLTLLTAFGFGLIPSMLAGRDTASGLREAGRSGNLGARRKRVRAALVAAEIAACTILLAGSGLLLRALWRLHGTGLGFEVQNRLTLRTALPMPKYDSVARREVFYTQVLAQVTMLPGVAAAGYTSFLPVAMGGGIFEVKLPDTATEKSAGRYASIRYVTPDYFRAMGIPMLKGRGTGDQDTQASMKVAVVSQSFVDQFLSGKGPALGQTFEFAFFNRTIVGVVGNVRVRGYERASEPQVYLPYRQIPDGWMPFFAPKDLVIQTADSSGTAAAVRRIVAAADPDQPVSMVRSMDELVAADTQSRTTQLYVLGMFAGAALLLAAVGIHGVLAFGVSERRREIGVRLALGAMPGDILRLVLREGVVLGAAGLAIGITGAMMAGRGLVTLLAGVSPFDPPAFAAAAGLCAVMSLIGSLGPAIRAVRVDPAESIRAE